MVRIHPTPWIDLGNVPSGRSQTQERTCYTNHQDRQIRGDGAFVVDGPEGVARLPSEGGGRAGAENAPEGDGWGARSVPQEQEGVPPAPDVTPDSVFVVLRPRRASVRRLVVVGEERGHQSGTEFSEIESTAGSFAFPRPFLPSYRFSFPPVHVPGPSPRGFIDLNFVFSREMESGGYLWVVLIWSSVLRLPENWYNAVSGIKE